jgi:hypothetical protein
LSNYYAIVSKDGSSSGQREYLLFYDNLASRFALSVYRATDTGAQVNADFLGTPAINTWYFIVGWHDSVNDQVCIQVNGGRANKVATGGSLQAASTGEFRIGHSEKFQTSFSLPPLPGRVNTVGLTKRILSATERETLFGDGLGRTNPFSGGGSSTTTRSINSVSGTTSAGSTANTDYVYLCNGTFTITLPTAVGNTNRYTIKNIGTGTITVATTSSQTIDGVTTQVIGTQYLSLDFISNNSNWSII